MRMRLWDRQRAMGRREAKAAHNNLCVYCFCGRTLAACAVDNYIVGMNGRLGPRLFACIQGHIEETVDWRRCLEQAGIWSRRAERIVQSHGGTVDLTFHHRDPSRRASPCVCLCSCLYSGQRAGERRQGQRVTNFGLRFPWRPSRRPIAGRRDSFLK